MKICSGQTGSYCRHLLAIIFLLLVSISGTAKAAQPGPPSASKLSIHLLNGYTSGAKKIVQARPRVFKIMDTHSSQIQALREYKSLVPDGIVVFRTYTPVVYSLSDNPVTAANHYWGNWLRPALQRIPASDRALIDYVEGPNEGDSTPTWNSLAEAQWLNDFWMALAPLIADAGFRPNAYSISVGNPPGTDNQIHQFLNIIAPSLKLIKSLGGSWGYHAYTIQYTTNTGIEYWYSLRYRLFYSYFAQAHPELMTLPIILTEGGVDGQSGPDGPGWKGGGDADKYKNWLRWFDGELRKDPYVVGVTLFQSGDLGDRWRSFDIEPVADWLAQYIKDGLNTPFLSVEPGSVSAASVTGLNASSQILKVKNEGQGDMPYTISADVNWLQLNPGSGINPGGVQEITLKFKSAHLPAGTYTGTITVSAPEANNSPQSIPVQLVVKPGSAAGQPAINQIKHFADNTPVIVRNKVVTAALYNQGAYYIQESSRSAGIRVHAPATLSFPGEVVDVLGTMSTRVVNGVPVERQIVAYQPGGIQKAGNVELPLPLGMNLPAIGGGQLNQITPAIQGGVGLHNTGLLARTTGWVRSVSGGVAVLRPTPSGNSGPPVYVGFPLGTVIPVGRMVQVTGIITGYAPSGASAPQRQITARTPSDVIVLN